jgi:hypothetical protein
MTMACSNGTHFKDDQQSIEEDVQEDVDSGFS